MEIPGPSPITGLLNQISVAADGTVWGTQSSGSIFQYKGNNQWTQISGNASMVSVGSASNIWAVYSGNLYQYNGNNGWNQINGYVGAQGQVSVASDGTVVACNPTSGIAYLYNGNNAWTQLPGNNNNGQLSTYTGPWAQVVAASAQQIWGRDPAGNTYIAQLGNTAQPWGRVEEYAPATSFSVASDGSVALIDSTGTTQVYFPGPVITA